jgi:antitoxin HigA-1
MYIPAWTEACGDSTPSIRRRHFRSCGISPEMALRLGRFCGNGPGLWLRMQQSYDLWKAEEELADELKHIPAHRALESAFNV